MIATTLWLSHQNWIRLPEKWGYHSAQARTTGKSSCHSILIPLVLLMSKCGGHLPWNHLPLKKPPNPIALAAAVHSCRSGEEVTQESRKKDGPFHWERNTFHIWISLENSLFNRIWWKRFFTPRVRFIMRWRKALPGTATLQANCRVPIRDWRSRRRVERRSVKESNNCLIVASLSSGNCASMRLLSNTTPINSRTCEGPRVLEATVGTLRDMKTLRRVVKLPRQAKFVFSAIKKSSKMWMTWRRP